jgi:hypothetical protein
MKLRIKEEYKEWSVAVKTIKKIKLKNLDPFFYEEVYKSHPEFFIIEKEKPVVKEVKKEEDEKITNLPDDTNK